MYNHYLNVYDDKYEPIIKYITISPPSSSEMGSNIKGDLTYD